MTGGRIFGVVLLAGLLGLAAVAQGSGQAVPPRAPHPQPGKNQPPRPAHNTGDWIRNHKDLSPEQQEKALESDPAFKKLESARQAALKERLRKFNSLPPQQRERAMARWKYLESLSPQQREQLRQANQELRGLPGDRQLMVHKAVRSLRQMTPEGREEVYKSDRFHNTFSSQEQDILKRLAGISAEPGRAPGK